MRTETDSEPINPNEGEGALIWMLIGMAIGVVLICKYLI